ncbi:hypothetical protein GCM10017674_00740 [Streptomyces gardneri]|uniref:Uncharacterized protein n=1 Tax=Streptomyces gardneri TaxID=66892 RepID=A0A4Y3RRJ2_9ACTN|nr:hypothetical protein SGA01_49480 [Streptomyces gardneri]GHG80689.1 hypothetical protein GCM10017674_00740 [Streptomyces gardneri]
MTPVRDTGLWSSVSGPVRAGNADGAAYSDALSVYAALGRYGVRGAGAGPRCHGGYFGSLLNFEVDQK